MFINILPALSMPQYTPYLTIIIKQQRIIGYIFCSQFRKYDLIANSIFDSCEPVIVPVMTIEEINDRKIIVAEIRAGMAKPFYLRRYGMMEGTYVRVAGVTRKAEDYMIKELQLEGSSRGFDGMQVAGEITEDEIKVLCERMYQSALERCVYAGI